MLPRGSALVWMCVFLFFCFAVRCAHITHAHENGAPAPGAPGGQALRQAQAAPARAAGLPLPLAAAGGRPRDSLDFKKQLLLCKHRTSNPHTYIILTNDANTCEHRDRDASAVKCAAAFICVPRPPPHGHATRKTGEHSSQAVVQARNTRGEPRLSP